MATPPTPDAEVLKAVNAVVEHGNRIDAARALGVSLNWIAHRLILSRERGILPTAKAPEKPSDGRGLGRDDHERRMLQARLSDALKRLQRAEERALLHDMYAAMASAADPPAWKIERRKRGGYESTACAVVSDWHAGEYVDPATVGGLNQFDLETLERRARRLFDGIVQLTEINRAHTTIENLVLFILGDLINGFLHFESVQSNTLTPPEEILRVYELLMAGLRFLLEHGGFRRILVACKAGNHGRMTEKPVVSTFSRTNLEYMLYSFLRSAFSDEKRLDWHISPAYLDHLELYDKTIRFHHGHAIRYKGGVGGIYVPLGQRTKEWNETRHANFDVFGHLHRYTPLAHAVGNGSLIGYNPFAQDRVTARFEPPTQAFFLLHPTRHFRTCDWPIDLDPADRKAGKR